MNPLSLSRRFVQLPFTALLILTVTILAHAHSHTNVQRSFGKPASGITSKDYVDVRLDASLLLYIRCPLNPSGAVQAVSTTVVFEMHQLRRWFFDAKSPTAN